MKQNKIALCTLLLIVLSGIILAATANAAPAESGTALKVTSADGKDVTLTINGNVAASQISELWFASNPELYNNTDIAFMLSSQSNTVQFMNMTVPKSALLDNTAPIVTIDGVWIKDSGYCQDSDNVYVWFTAPANSVPVDRSNVQITFLLKPNLTAIAPTLGYLYTVGLVVVSLLVALLFVLVMFKRHLDKQRFQAMPV